MDTHPTIISFHNEVVQLLVYYNNNSFCDICIVFAILCCLLNLSLNIGLLQYELLAVLLVGILHYLLHMIYFTCYEVEKVGDTDIIYGIF